MGKPRFVPIESDKGFDETENWQMVPSGGARGLKLYDGTGLNLRMKWDKLTYNEVQLTGSDHREIWVSGQKPGTGVLEAYGSDYQTKASIDLEVFEQRTLDVAYFIIKSQIKTGGKWSPNLTDGDIAGIHKQVNQVLFDQANVLVNLKTFGTRETFEDLGSRVEWTTAQPALRLIAHDRGVSHYVLFVWAIPDKGGGQSFGDYTLVSTLHTRTTEIYKDVAHELGHSICPAPGPDAPLHDCDLGLNYLMCDSPGHGAKVGKRRVREITRT